MKRTNYIITTVFVAVITLFIHTAAKQANAEQLSNFIGKWQCSASTESIEDFGKYLTSVNIKIDGTTETSLTFMQRRPGEIFPQKYTNINGNAEIGDDGNLYYEATLNYTDTQTKDRKILWFFGCNGQLKDTKFGYLEMECIGYGMYMDEYDNSSNRCSMQCKKQFQHRD